MDSPLPRHSKRLCFDKHLTMAVRSPKMRRLFDLLFVSFCLVLAAFPMLFIALAIRVFDGTPVFWSQVRVGRGMQPFRLYKFRTMKVFAEHPRSLTVGMDPRITRLGYWLRRYHLDELPQLFNILKGDMSFIGPRPEIPEFVDLQDPIQVQVLQFLPGLFDDATLYWLNEAQILGQVEDWKEYYCQVILPDKLKRSLNCMQTRSLKNDFRLTMKAISLLLFQ